MPLWKRYVHFFILWQTSHEHEITLPQQGVKCQKVSIQHCKPQTPECFTTWYKSRTVCTSSSTDQLPIFNWKPTIYIDCIRNQDSVDRQRPQCSESAVTVALPLVIPKTTEKNPLMPMFHYASDLHPCTMCPSSQIQQWEDECRWILCP